MTSQENFWTNTENQEGPAVLGLDDYLKRLPTPFFQKSLNIESLA